MSDAEKPKIIIDDDWKAQAQAEKAKLAEQEKAKQPGAPAPAASAGAPEPGADGPIGFTDLVQVLASQALLYMGAMPDPQTGRAVVSPPMARVHIDLLGVLEEKTKGNLTGEETALIQGVLHELRMQFVELGKMIEQAIREGKISPQQAGDMGMGQAPMSLKPG